MKQKFDRFEDDFRTKKNKSTKHTKSRKLSFYELDHEENYSSYPTKSKYKNEYKKY